MFYACLVFFVIMQFVTSPMYASEVEANQVYCQVKAHEYKGSRGFWGFLKDTFSCEVKVEYEIEMVGGSAEVELSWESKDKAQDVWEKTREYFKE
jgi:hypothetical protein